MRIAFIVHNPVMTSVELARLGQELGLDAVGAAPAAPYDETERHIRERRERGLFAGMGFTMARPEVSCHPETLLAGREDRRLGGALLLRAGAGARAGGGHASPATPGRTATRELREKLDALGRRLGGSYRVLVDANQHVDREGAARAGVGFYGKNTLLITQRHGSWVVLGTLVTDVEIEPRAPLDLDCGSCRLCIDACPTGALDEPGTLDSTRCLSYWTQAPDAIPEEYRAELGASVYGCDICQDVCPWNRGVEKRRAGRASAAGAEPTVSLARVARGGRGRSSSSATTGCTCRATTRASCAGTRSSRPATSAARAERPAVAAFAESDDPLLREHAEWALATTSIDRISG